MRMHTHVQLMWVRRCGHMCVHTRVRVRAGAPTSLSLFPSDTKHVTNTIQIQSICIMQERARVCASVRECACMEYYPKNKERRKAHEREGGVRRRGNALVLSLHVPGFPPIFDIAHIQRRLVHLFLFLRLPRQPPHLRSGASQRTSTGLQLGHCSLHPTVQANG